MRSICRAVWLVQAVQKCRAALVCDGGGKPLDMQIIAVAPRKSHFPKQLRSIFSVCFCHHDMSNHICPFFSRSRKFAHINFRSCVEAARSRDKHGPSTCTPQTAHRRLHTNHHIQHFNCIAGVTIGHRALCGVRDDARQRARQNGHVRRVHGTAARIDDRTALRRGGVRVRTQSGSGPHRMAFPSAKVTERQRQSIQRLRVSESNGMCEPTYNRKSRHALCGNNF